MGLIGDGERAKKEAIVPLNLGHVRRLVNEEIPVIKRDVGTLWESFPDCIRYFIQSMSECIRWPIDVQSNDAIDDIVPIHPKG